MDRRIFVAGTTLLPALTLSSCATRASIEDGTLVKPNQGLLAFKISSGVYAKLDYVKYEADRSMGAAVNEFFSGPVGKFSVDRGDTYFVYPLEAGEYMWGFLEIGMGHVARMHSSNRFVVKQSSITYVGHLSLEVVNRHVDMRSSDQEQDMRAHLAAAFPKYANSMAFNKAIAEFRLRG